MTIYIGNISYTLSEEEITRIFEVMGKVESIKLIRDKRTGKSKRLLFFGNAG